MSFSENRITEKISINQPDQSISAIQREHYFDVCING